MTFTEFYQSSNSFGSNRLYAFVLWVQARLETNNFQNTTANANNNIYGMGVAKVRPQNNIGSYIADGGRSLARFASLSDCINDRVALDLYNGVQEPVSLTDVRRYMLDVQTKGFACAKHYLNSWANAFNTKAVSEGYNTITTNFNDLGVDGLNYTVCGGSGSSTSTSSNPFAPETTRGRLVFMVIILVIIGATALYQFTKRDQK